MRRGAGEPGAVLDRLVLTSPQQRVFRLLVVVGAIAFLVTAGVAGGDAHPFFTTFGVLLALLAAVLPESNVPLALQLYLGGWWLVATPARLDAWTLVAALAFTVVHLATTLAATGPSGTVIDPALTRRWWVRAAGCLAAAVVVWLVATAWPDHDPSGLLLAAALLLAVGWCVVVALRLARAHAATGGGGL
jgi:hypothetical protein